MEDLTALLSWSGDAELWMWPKGIPRAEILLTDAGLAEARKILSEDGYPLPNDGQSL